MRILDLPHRTAPYRCPVNGLCDIYEWKTGSRIPESLIFDSRIGFELVYLPKNKPPKMIFMGEGGIGKRQYEFWSQKIGYNIIYGENESFENTAPKLKLLVNQGIPVIIFGLDMYHLPYHKNFYHKVHIQGHVNLLIGYNDNEFYVYDNDCEGIQKISNTDLEQAGQMGILT